MKQEVNEMRFSATIGIVVPCYNLGQYIQEAIDSIASQTFTDYELIVVDDASTDTSTRTKLKNLVLPKNAKVVFEKKNLGLSGVRNKYMSQFKTKYVFSFDPDDKLDPKFLEKSIQYLETHPDMAAVATWLKRFGIETGTTKFSENRAKLPEMLITNNYLGSCPLRKKVFEEIGGYDTAKVMYGAEDYDFWLSVLGQGWLLGVIEEPLFYYRRLRTSSSFNSALPENAVAWRKYIVKKHINLYSQYIVDVVAGFEKRASESHAGYIELVQRHDDLIRDYETVHTYIEEELLPKLTLTEAQLRRSVYGLVLRMKARLQR